MAYFEISLQNLLLGNKEKPTNLFTNARPLDVKMGLRRENTSRPSPGPTQFFFVDTGTEVPPRR
jgi:hypothetical protein